jgi:hypothetical protein
MDELNAGIVQARLGLTGRFREWLDRLAVPAQPHELVLPDDSEADALLKRLGVQPHDRAACLAARPDPATDPELWWVLRRAWQDLLARMGRNPAQDGYIGWPALPDSADPLGRQLYVWVFLAAVPDFRRFHQERGIPDEVSWTTLAGLGTEMAVWNAVYGGSGLNGTWMLPLIFQGVSYRLGRHVFDRGGGDLNVHIPAGSPLDPVSSQASFDRAREFFPRHFPEERVASFGCHSWLLDDQWAQYLPESSNIVQFQRRFAVDPDEPAEPGDNDILQFIFHRTPDGPEISPALIDSLPQDTTLQRAFVAHLRAGNHWWTRTGWFPFLGDA